MNKPASNSVKPMVKSPKKCPDNKVLNPKTGRYITPTEKKNETRLFIFYIS